jgi:hypothetical protein
MKSASRHWDKLFFYSEDYNETLRMKVHTTVRRTEGRTDGRSTVCALYFEPEDKLRRLLDEFLSAVTYKTWHHFMNCVVSIMFFGLHECSQFCIQEIYREK